MPHDCLGVHDFPHVTVALGAQLALSEVSRGAQATVWTCVWHAAPTATIHARRKRRLRTSVSSAAPVVQVCDLTA